MQKQPSRQTILSEPLVVLLVDDEPQYHARVASVVKSAEQSAQLRVEDSYDSGLYGILNQYADLVILDLVLHGRVPGPQETWEGIWILQSLVERGLNEHVPVVILTQFGTMDTAISIFKNYAIVDFLDKGKPPDVLVGDLRAALRRQNYFGLHCQVRFGEDVDWKVLVTNLARDYRRLSAPIKEDDAVFELKHLIRKLFADCSMINIRPIQSGHSGAAVVRVTPTLLDGTVGADVIVKYGQFDQIKQEAANWTSIEPYCRGPKITHLKGQVLGRHLGALTYSLVGSDSGAIRPFPQFYAEGGVEQIAEALDDLFQDTCGLWYAQKNRTDTGHYDISGLYESYLGLEAEKLKQAYLFKFPDKPLEMPRIEFNNIPESFPHPIAEYLNGRCSFRIQSWLCRTHGDMHGGNLFVDVSNRSVWMIDFYRTNIGHWARDFVALETAIRFQYTPARDLSALHDFELVMQEPVSKGNNYIRDDQPELTKAATVVRHLRSLAMAVAGSTESSRLDYDAALFFETLNYLRYHGLIRSATRKNHVLMAAAMMYESLRNRIGS